MQIASNVPQGRVSWRPIAYVVIGLSAFGLAIHFSDPQRLAAAQNFFIVFGSLLVEATPFILLGALVSAGIEVFVPTSVFLRLARLPAPLQLPAAAVAGFAFPVCECGSVPVARRLAAKGLSPAAAVTFMLAAPILNPVVLASTFVAYRGREVLMPMLLGRAGLGFVAAMAVGWVISARSSADLLKSSPDAAEEHDHDHHDRARRWPAFFAHLASDFIFMGRFLVLGAIVAATMQTFVPQSIIGSVAGTPVIDLLSMMALAFVLSLCSESDAFVAASFVQFGIGAQLAFLVFGPMIDTKLGFLYTGTFKRGFFRTVVVVVTAVTLVGCLWMEVIFG